MEIHYYRRDSYGNTLYYIKDSNKRIGIEQLIKKKTITKDEMSLFSKLFDVKFVQVLAPEEETPL
tara:strand:+ start:75 stop:269 length:195 start_codon:yes stop_codon:yes gene_type:complete